MTARILVVDDDQALAEMIGIVLRGEGYATEICGNGLKVQEAVRRGKPDLVLLDLMLPGKDGTQVCREIRRFSGVPIIMVTARSDTRDVVEGLAAGADDYIQKPFKPVELVARVKARLRRHTVAAPPTGEQIRIGDAVIDLSGHQVTKAGKPIPLTPLEFDLLVALGAKPWQVFTREMLLEQVWGYRDQADPRLVNVHVQRLRSKIEEDPENPSVVVTVRGVGYRAGPTS
ncbi:MAG: MtrAB system response regulator MtrA [Micrococcales bacterium]|nr:MtrAB system response regulator MtrA [Micrococcales bacterium]